MSHIAKFGMPRLNPAFIHACSRLAEVALPAYLFHGACTAVLSPFVGPMVWVVGLPGGVITLGAIVVSLAHRYDSCPACAPLGDAEALAAIYANPKLVTRFHWLRQHRVLVVLAYAALIVAFLGTAWAVDSRHLVSVTAAIGLGLGLLYANLITHQHHQVRPMCPQCP